MASRDSQSITLSVIQPTSAAVRVSQSITLSLALPTSALVRNSQSITLALTLPTSALVRTSQSVVLAVVSNQVLQPQQLKVQHPIVGWRKHPKIKPRLGFTQNAALLAAARTLIGGAFQPNAFQNDILFSIKAFQVTATTAASLVPVLLQPVHAARAAQKHAKHPVMMRVPGIRRRMPQVWVIQ